MLQPAHNLWSFSQGCPVHRALLEDDASVPTLKKQAARDQPPQSGSSPSITSHCRSACVASFQGTTAFRCSARKLSEILRAAAIAAFSAIANSGAVFGVGTSFASECIKRRAEALSYDLATARMDRK